MSRPPIVPELLSVSGLTYRQLDYWTSRGLIRADENSPGSGHPRAWSDREMAIARVILRLTDAGVSLRVAAAAARSAVENADTSVELAPGIFIDITLEGDL
jgi:DNA-binding transcriptional MerR regulator